jgi:aspartyl/glutamyl-tRNA(Asn/Gln) amidotransferase C subunit
MTSKTKISAAQVRQLGNLAKISMTESEEKKMKDDLASILEYFDIVDRVKDDVGVDHPEVGPAELRRDEVGPSDPDGVMRGVPQRKGRYVKAPRVF